MPLVPEHTHSIRQPGPPEPEMPPVEIVADDSPAADPNGDVRIMDDQGNVIKIHHLDGSTTLSIDGSPLELAKKEKKEKKWFDNLVGEIDADEVSRIAEDLLRDIDDDITSRTDWLEDRAICIKMMGTKIEIPNTQTSSDSAPVEGMNKVRHPLLMEAVLRFQANTYGEMLPTDGPMKIKNDDGNQTLSTDEMANALENDMNHYLTSTATEYYPDTDRMFLQLGLCGTIFKKVYFCPLRNRPVSETVDAEDLIVNNAATDLQNAKRITHRSMVKPSTIKRMQILGHYRKVELSDALAPTLDSVQAEKKAQQGIATDSARAQDRYREIYEVLCELDVKGFEHKWDGEVTGLEIPYKVTIDVSSRQVLAITRNYKRTSSELPTALRVYVKFTFVPGFGFYDLGLGNILGNTTNAVTAAWRELLDAGMFSNFPGFLLADVGARQNTNVFRIPAGGAALIKTGGRPIGEVVSNLPYKEPSMALMNLTKDMAETGQRLGGTAELQVGEGKQEAPVGTTLAMIEQAQKVLNSVHKRIHRAQSDEFALLIACFREHPESFWQRNDHPATKWDEAKFRQALDNYGLVPKADPNTASYLQRALKVMGIKQLQTASPAMYDPRKVDTAVLRTMGWSNPQEFFASPEAAAQPPPELLQAQAKMKAETMDAETRRMVGQAKVAETQEKIKLGTHAPGNDGPPDPALGAANMIKAKATLMDAQTRQKQLPIQAHDAAMKFHDARVEDQNRDQDRASRERVALLALAKDLISHHADMQASAHEQAHDHQHERETQAAEHDHEAEIQAADHENAIKVEKAKPKPTAKPAGKKK